MEVAALAYVVVTARDPGEWRSFGETVLGMAANPSGTGIALRMDERAGRVFDHPGGIDG